MFEVVLDEEPGLVGGQRRAEEEALPRFAPERAQQLELRSRLDAFGDHLTLETLRDVDHRSHDDAARIVVGQRVDEAAVDLDLRDAELSKLFQRAVAEREAADGG